MIPGVGAGGGGVQEGPRPVRWGPGGWGPGWWGEGDLAAAGSAGASGSFGAAGAGDAGGASAGRKGGGCCLDQPGRGSGAGGRASPESVVLAPSSAGLASSVGSSSGVLSVMSSYPIVAVAVDPALPGRCAGVVPMEAVGRGGATTIVPRGVFDLPGNTPAVAFRRHRNHCVHSGVAGPCTSPVTPPMVVPCPLRSGWTWWYRAAAPGADDRVAHCAGVVGRSSPRRSLPWCRSPNQQCRCWSPRAATPGYCGR